MLQFALRIQNQHQELVEQATGLVPGHPFEFFGLKHNLYLLGTAFCWLLVVLIGRHLTEKQRRWVVIFLAFLTLGQELADDLLRAYNGVWFAWSALPFHLCSLALFMGVWAILTKKQLVFEVAYYWSLAAATQALLTPDNTRWLMGEIDVFWNFLSHGLVILNVLWLVFVEGMKVRRGSWLSVWIISNITMIPIAVINLIIGPPANYFFICRRPGGASPFLWGDWPWYILGFEVMGLIIFFLIYIPMLVARKRREARQEG
jgi:hypothetical integral membrane protein (TIGR02206 family)